MPHFWQRGGDACSSMCRLRLAYELKWRRQTEHWKGRSDGAIAYFFWVWLLCDDDSAFESSGGETVCQAAHGRRRATISGRVRPAVTRPLETHRANAYLRRGPRLRRDDNNTDTAQTTQEGWRQRTFSCRIVLSQLVASGTPVVTPPIAVSATRYLSADAQDRIPEPKTLGYDHIPAFSTS